MLKRKLLPLFLTQSLRSVAVSFLGFFSSVYIYKQVLEFTDNHQQAFLAVAIFYLFLYLAKIVAACLAENGAWRFGLKTQVLLGHVLTVLTLVAFFLSQNQLNFIWLAGALWGLAIGFFWFGRFGLMLKISQSGRFGRTLGWAGVVDTLLLLGVPAAGGFLTSHYGYSALFLVSLGFALLAIIALAKVPTRKTHQDVRFGEVLRLFINHKRMALAYAATGARGAFYSTVWLLYVFLALEGEMNFGIFFSLALALVAVTNFATGHWVDKRSKKPLVVYGAVIGSLVWLGRFVVGATGGLFVLDVIDRVSGGMLGIPLEVLTYEKALDGRSTGRALLFRETALTLGSILACFLFSLVVLAGWPLRTVFLIAMLFNVLPLLAIKQVQNAVSR